MKVDYEGSFYIKVGRKYLKIDIDTTYIENLQKQNSKLETQVKQMQNFENCDYQQHIQDCPVFNSDKSMSCKECPYWKLQRPINEFVKQRYDAPEEKFLPVDTSKMTTEERLMNEAEEYADENDICVCDEEYWSHNDIKQAYLAGAEPREKRIVELEKQIKQMESDVRANIKLGCQNKNWQLESKLTSMINQWKCKYDR